MRRFDFLDLDKRLLESPEKYWTYEDILASIPSANFKRGDIIKYNNFWSSVQEEKRKIERILKKNGLQLDYKNGKDAKKGFRYPQGIKDPIHFEKEDYHKFQTKQLLRLVSASIGLFPQTWLANIINGAQTLVNDNGKLVSFDHNKDVENLQLVPTIFDAIEKHKVLSFRYKPRYEETGKDIILHPYFLKEYNNSWFTFGLTIDKDGNASDSNIALDRIEGEIFVDEEIEYICPKNKSYATDFFKDIIGVTKYEKEVLTIKIETHDPYTHHRIKARPLHSSQEELRPFTKKQPGLFSIKVIHNNELDTLLLSYGSNIRIIEPNNYLDSFREMVQKLSDLYFLDEKSGKKEEGKSSKDSPTENSTKDVQE